MKKLLFVLAFAFIGQQVFSQMYIVTLANYNINGCDPLTELTLTTVTNTGTETHTCIPKDINNGALISLNQELNSVSNLGYKLVETSYFNSGNNYGNGLISTWNNGQLNIGTAFIFAIP